MGPLQAAVLAQAMSMASTLRERMLPGIQVSLLGMGVVFLALILLFLMVRIAGGSIIAAQRRGQPAGQAPEPEPVLAAGSVLVQEGPAAVAAVPAEPADSTPAAGGEQVSGEEQVCEGRLVAAISAALAASIADLPGAQPALRSEARPARLGWALAGRIESLRAAQRLPRY